MEAWNFDFEELDTSIAPYILQYSLFGEIMYGRFGVRDTYCETQDDFDF